MNYIDLHIHLLSDTDDGAADEATMETMLDVAYLDGARMICVTPHFHPGYFGNTPSKGNAAFVKLREYAKKYPDLYLYRGNELRYDSGCLDWLEQGACRTLNGSRYLLVDFSEFESAEHITDAVCRLFNAGYIPVLAHAERYGKLHSDFREITYFRQLGVLIQVDAGSPFGEWGHVAKVRSRKLIAGQMADLLASDGHNLTTRPPKMQNAIRYVSKKCGEAYAKKICRIVPETILRNLTY